jgi:excisionase family DNA binding protein
MKPRLIKIAEAAEMIGVHPRTYKRWASRGRVPEVIELGEGERRVVLAELEEWIEVRRNDRSAGTD